METSAIIPLTKMNASVISVFINMGAWKKKSVELLYAKINLLLEAELG